jgi:PKD repeat protein
MTRKKLWLTIGVLLLCLAVVALADTRWIKFDGTIVKQTPQVVITASDSTAFAFRAHVPTMQVRDIELDGEVFQQIDFKGSGVHSTPGEPAVPVLSRWIAVPEGATPKITIEAGVPRIVQNVMCNPAQHPAADCYGPEEPEFTIDDALYNQDALFPGRLYSVDGPYTIRGLQMILLRLYPAQVNPATGEAHLYADLQVRVDFPGSKGNFFSDRRGRSFQRLYDLAANRMAFSNEPMAPPTGKSATGAEFVILTAPHLVDAAATLADWKILQGYDTEVYTTDDTGLAVADIKAWVQDAYDTWDPAPEFILFLGDAEFISPTYNNPSIGSDLYYVTVDGGDEWADIAHARISVDTLTEAQDHIDAIVAYQRTPIVDPSFYTTSVHAAYFQHASGGYAERRFCRTTEETFQWFDQYMVDSPFNPERIYFTESYTTPKYWNQSTYAWTPTWWTYGDVDVPPEILRSNGFTWDGDAEDVAAAVNAGTAFLTHRDHGDIDGWSEPAFSSAQATALTNGDKLPVVWSINCLTGYFDEETDKAGGGKATDRFSEAWERNPNGGAVGVLASTRISYSGRNDRLFWGWLDSMWPTYEPEYPDTIANDPEWRMSLVMDYGKMYMSYHYASDPYRLTAIEEFHWFGDPTMEMWAGEPQTMTPEFMPVLPMGATSFDVTIDVDDALVSLVQDGLILGKAYSVGGEAHVEFDAPISALGDVNLTVTRRNYRPYEDMIMVGATADGIVGLNRSAYPEDGVVRITLSDSDLTDLGTYALTITSDTEGAGEDVDLTEIEIEGSGTGTFIGEIQLTPSAPSADGDLSVSDGDDVIVTYWDVNTGGGSGLEKFDSAYADCAPPTFSGISEIDAGDSEVELGWVAATDLTGPITYRVYRAETSGGQNFTVPVAETTETAYLDRGLENFVTYYYVVRSVDAFGHVDTNTAELSDETIGPIVIWEEDFDDKAGIPGDWEIDDLQGPACTWTDDNPGGQSSPQWDSIFAIADSENCGMFTKWDDGLITESVDLYGYTEITLAFTHEFEQGDSLFPAHAIVEISNDGGTTWTTVVNWKDERAGLDTLDISEWADNKTDVKIKFRYTVNSNGAYWGIDNLQLIGYPNTDAPTADFSASPVSGNVPLTVHFTPDTEGAIDSYSWNFGDGGNSTDQYPEHIYTASGSFNVSLTVTGPYGDDTITKTGYVDVVCGAPDVDFDADVVMGEAPLEVNFSDSTVSYEGCEPESVFWEFGDGGTSTETDPTHVYAERGIYSVRLTYTLPGSGTASETKVALIQVTCGPPVVDFTASVTTGDAPLTVVFTDASSATTGCDITGRTWTITDEDGDERTYNSSSPQVTFTAPGLYDVSLEAVNLAGPGLKLVEDMIDVIDPAAADDDDTTADDDDDDASPTDDDDVAPADDDDDDDDDGGCGC